MSGKTNRELSRFLFTRGLWLIVLEFTVIRLLITFNLDYASNFGMAQVIWVIGVSMIVMAALIHLPLKVVGLLGLAMIVLHNLLDGITFPPQIAFGGLARLFPSRLACSSSTKHYSGRRRSSIFIAYPLIPWIGVMAVGYALGARLPWNARRRRKLLLTIGLVATLLFVAAPPRTSTAIRAGGATKPSSSRT